jgi:hypothetical protein
MTTRNALLARVVEIKTDLVVAREPLELSIEKGESVLQILSISRTRAGLQIVKYPSTGQQKTVALLFDLALLCRQAFLRRSLLHCGIIPL